MPDGQVAPCYAKTVAEGLARGAYPNGFRHYYWHPERLEEPIRERKPCGIFLDSMSDLMGGWVPPEHIEQVLDVCRRATWHIFFLLTKYAPRLVNFTFPPNVWVGVSLPPSHMWGKSLSANQQRQMFRRSMAVLEQVDVPVRWVSFEPLSWDVAGELVLYHPPFEWAVIGAASHGRAIYQPDPDWVTRLHVMMDRYQIPVFHKGNLAWDPHREDYPTSRFCQHDWHENGDGADYYCTKCRALLGRDMRWSEHQRRLFS